MKILTLSLCAVAAFAQSALVVPLSKADAEHAKGAYEAMKKAEADWQSVQTDIEHKYISDSQEVTDSISTLSGDLSGTTLNRGVYLHSNGNGTLSLVSDATTETNPCVVYRGSEAIDTSESPLCIAYRKVQKDRADKAEREEKERIAKLPKHTVYTPKDGWRDGFEFSPDFQFIVPKPRPQQPQSWPYLATTLN